MNAPTELQKQKTICTNRVRRLAVRSDNMKTDKVITAMIEYFGSDKKRIHHFLKVYSFSKTIGESENLSTAEQELLEIAAIVHDIGIRSAKKSIILPPENIRNLKDPVRLKGCLQISAMKRHLSTKFATLWDTTTLMEILTLCRTKYWLRRTSL